MPRQGLESAREVRGCSGGCAPPTSRRGTMTLQKKCFLCRLCGPEGNVPCRRVRHVYMERLELLALAERLSFLVLVPG